METRVSNIEKTIGGDGFDLWVVSFEGKKLTLTEKQQPTYKVGDILPFNLKVIKPPAGQKGDWYYVRADGDSKGQYSPQARKPQSTKSTKNDDDIMLQVAFKGAVELEQHHNPPEGKINTARVIQATSELFAGLILMRPKKE